MTNQYASATDFEPDHHRGYAFGDYVLDLDRCALLKSGEDTGLARHTVHMLALLVEHQGVPVSEADLREHVWGESAEDSDDDVASCLVELQRTLDDDLRSAIRSLPGDRFVFEHTVRPLEELAIAPRLDKQNYMERYAMVLIALIVLMFLGLKLFESDGGTDGATPSVPAPVDERGR